MERGRRYYKENEIVPFEEDSTHEFKGHCNLSEEEIPKWATLDNSDRRSRQPVSRAINAFLNSGKGGTVYLGIVDNGSVKGLNLTQYKKDHVYISLEHLMNRYKPPVEKHRYKVKFIPIVPANTNAEHIDKIVSHDPRDSIDQVLRADPHAIGTNRYCWCDRDTLARLNNGILVPLFVIEITIKEWNRDDPLNRSAAVGEMKSYPIHEDETEKVYIRRQASIQQCSKDEMLTMSKQIAKDHYQPELERLKREVQELKSKVSEK